MNYFLISDSLSDFQERLNFTKRQLQDSEQLLLEADEKIYDSRTKSLDFFSIWSHVARSM